MHRKQILEQIDSVRGAHLRWRVEMLDWLARQDDAERAVKPSPAECGFSQWYVTASPILGALPAYHALDLPRRQLNQRLLEIRAMLQGVDPAWARLLGFERKLRADRMAAAARALAQLQASSDQLLMGLERLAAAVCELDEIDWLSLEPAAV
ncbi:MAG: hypothetical protein ACFCUG_14155 [Thiotrichales bacterium]